LYTAVIPVLIFASAMFLTPRGILIVAAFGLAGFSFIAISQNVGWIPAPIAYAKDEALLFTLLVGNTMILCTGVMVSIFSFALLHRRHQVESSMRSYRNLVDIAPDPIIVWDPKGRITMANKAACDMLGYKSENDLIGKTGADIVPPDRLEEGNLKFREDLHSMEPTFREFEFLKSNDERVPVELHITPIRERHRVVGLLGICRDVSDRLRAEQQRHTLTEKLIMQDKMASLGRLILGIAHEYNNIFAGLRGYAQLAQLPGKENRMRELPGVTMDLIDRAQKVTEGLLTFSEKFEPDSNSVNILELVEGITKLMRKDFERNGIRVEVQIPEDSQIITDVSKLQQVLLNLISNASDAMPDGGVMQILYRKEGNEHYIEIEDEGKGIPAQDISHVFDPFYTTKGPLGAGAGHGIGLGLSICYNIVRGLGGDIDVVSMVEGGCIFKIVLPDDQAKSE